MWRDSHSGRFVQASAPEIRVALFSERRDRRAVAIDAAEKTKTKTKEVEPRLIPTPPLFVDNEIGEGVDSQGNVYPPPPNYVPPKIIPGVYDENHPSGWLQTQRARIKRNESIERMAVTAIRQNRDMYLPSAFQEERVEVLHALMRAHPLATLITAGPGGLLANLVPFLLVEGGPQGTLRAHVAKANDQVAALRAGAETLVVFQGQEAYITPTWYASKREHGRVVPTWNYAVVQAKGTPRLMEDETWLRAQIEALTVGQEAQRPAPWNVSDAPDAFIEGQLKAIVGVEIPIASMVGKWKVSQNRSEADRQGVIEGLRSEGLSEEMARMVQRKP